MVSQISHTYDFDRKFMEKRCSLSVSLYGSSSHCLLLLWLVRVITVLWYWLPQHFDCYFTLWFNNFLVLIQTCNWFLQDWLGFLGLAAAVDTVAGFSFCNHQNNKYLNKQINNYCTSYASSVPILLILILRITTQGKGPASLAQLNNLQILSHFEQMLSVLFPNVSLMFKTPSTVSRLDNKVIRLTKTIFLRSHWIRDLRSENWSVTITKDKIRQLLSGPSF